MMRLSIACSHTALFVALLLAVAAAAENDGSVPKRLRITNGCKREPIWIAHEAGPEVGPDEQNIRIDPGHTFNFQTPAGLVATRYWPKMGCNEEGGDCALGGSGGPGESCVKRPPEVKEDDYSRCAPPVDTKFEGTFDTGGFDFVDMSLVDGWTLPFMLTLSGGECTGQTGTHKSITIDCAGLSFDLCPRAEELTAAGITVDLRAVNPRTKEVAGCYAPCMKLLSGKWNNSEGKGRKVEDDEVAPYCCPTPPETPEACRAGPITQTGFLKAVHSKCPGVYGYAYDDGMGLLKCTPSSIYDLTFFCPDAKTTFPDTQEASRNDSKPFGKEEQKNVVSGWAHTGKHLIVSSGLQDEHDGIDAKQILPPPPVPPPPQEPQNHKKAPNEERKEASKPKNHKKAPNEERKEASKAMDPWLPFVSGDSKMPMAALSDAVPVSHRFAFGRVAAGIAAGIAAVTGFAVTLAFGARATRRNVGSELASDAATNVVESAEQELTALL